MMRDELRPVRLQLELLKPELSQQEHNIQATVVVFGSARIHEHKNAEIALHEAEQANEAKLKQSHKVNVVQRMLAKSHYYD